MKNDFSTYNENKANVQPFIISQIDDRIQTDVIFGTSEMKENKIDFIEIVLKHKGNAKVNNLNASVFRYKKFVAVALFISNKSEEYESKRKGLLFTIGFLMDFEYLENIHSPIWTYCYRYIEILNKIFDTDLVKDDATEILNYLRKLNSESPDKLQEKFERLIIEMINPIFFLKINNVSFFINKLKNAFSFKRNNLIPSRIICPVNYNKFEILKIFFNYIEKGILFDRKIDFSTNSFKNGLSLEIIPCLPVEFNNDINKKIKYQDNLIIEY